MADSTSSVRFAVCNTHGRGPQQHKQCVALIWTAQGQAAYLVTLTNYPIKIDTGVSLGTKVGVEVVLNLEIEFPDLEVVHDLGDWIGSILPSSPTSSKRAAKAERGGPAAGASRSVERAVDDEPDWPSPASKRPAEPGDTPLPVEPSEAILQFCVCHGPDSVCLDYGTRSQRAYYAIELLAKLEAPASPIPNETLVRVNLTRTIPIASAGVLQSLRTWIDAQIPAPTTGGQ